MARRYYLLDTAKVFTSYMSVFISVAADDQRTMNGIENLHDVTLLHDQLLTLKSLNDLNLLLSSFIHVSLTESSIPSRGGECFT